MKVVSSNRMSETASTESSDRSVIKTSRSRHGDRRKPRQDSDAVSGCFLSLPGFILIDAVSGRFLSLPGFISIDAVSGRFLTLPGFISIDTVSGSFLTLPGVHID